MKWIKVEDELPKIDEKVLVCSIIYGKEVEMGYYDPDFCDDRALIWRNAEFIEISVTHWMPLPELPKDV